MTGVSIIVPVKGDFNLKALLDSIGYSEYQIIIVGDSLGNAYINLPCITFIKSRVNRSEARNIGAKYSKYEILLFLDSDMELSNDFLDGDLNQILDFDALIFPEITLGNTIIAVGRRFERIGLYKSLYFEAPRMIKKSVFNNFLVKSRSSNAFNFVS